jgi:hypothetical protein
MKFITEDTKLFMLLLEMESMYKSNRMPSWKAWVQRPSGLIKMELLYIILKRPIAKITLGANPINFL